MTTLFDSLMMLKISRRCLFILILLVLATSIPDSIPMAKARSLSNTSSSYNCTIRVTNSNSNRLLVLIRGLGTSARNQEDQASDWSPLTDAIGDFYGGILYFSYRDGDANTYSDTDTSSGIFVHHVPLLHNVLEDCRTRYPRYQYYDLIGHSQGGVIANEYIKAYGFLSYELAAQKVAHVLTLDSPVNGLYYAYCVNMLGYDLCNLDLIVNLLVRAGQGLAVHTQSGTDLGALYQSHDIIKAQNVGTAKRLECRSNYQNLDTNVGYRNLSNHQDGAFYYGAEESIANTNYGKEFDLGTDTSLGHFLIYRDLANHPDVRADIRNFLRDPYPATPARCKVRITDAHFSPTALDGGGLLRVDVTVHNDGDTPSYSQEPTQGIEYNENDTFTSRGYGSDYGQWRIAVNATSTRDYPYRWGWSGGLAPGESRTITGYIRLTTPRTQDYWVGLVQEYVAWTQENVARTSVTVNPTTVTCPADKYRAEYFNNKDLIGPATFVQCEDYPIDHDWGSGGPGNGVGSDNFSVRWTGTAHIAEGEYTFFARSDDGIRVWMNRTNVFNEWYDQAATTEHTISGHVADGIYDFKIEYFEHAGAASARFRWERSATTCPTGQYKAEYYNNKTLSGTPVLIRCEATPINYEWQSDGPGNGVNSDNFSVRWTGRFNFNADNYNFNARTDDGMRVYIDGSELLNEWHVQGPTSYSRSRTMTASEHEVKVEYYEEAGWATAQFSWEASSFSLCSTTVGDYQIEYYNNQDLTGSPVYRTCGFWPIAVDYGSGGPGHGVGNDNFSARYIGGAYLEAGTYTFTARGDDGFRVWLDNVQIMNEWRVQAPFRRQVTLPISEGNHDIKIEYFENAGGALLEFDWERNASSMCSEGGVVVDDRDPGFQKHGPVGGWRDSAVSDTTYNSHAYWTYATNTWYGESANLNNWATWLPPLNAGGEYEVCAYVPHVITPVPDTSRARYIVTNSSGDHEVFIDQNSNTGRWVSLGSYTFATFIPFVPGGSTTDALVSLRDVSSDATSMPHQRTVQFDAIKWVPKSPQLQPGTVTGRVVNATSNQALSGAIVAVMGTSLTTTTSGDGQYTLSNVPSGMEEMSASKEGYVTATQSVNVVGSTTITANFAISPVQAAGEMRVVLEWGASPPDLDSHLWLPSQQPYHIYYRSDRRGSLTSFPYAYLDVDDQSGYGPETITIKQRVPGRYVYAVYNYSGTSPLSSSEARVSVYSGGSRIAAYSVPSGSGRWWTVFAIDGATGQVTPINTINDACPGSPCEGTHAVTELDGKKKAP